MLAYEFYWQDKEGVVHFIGILPERRKKIERITQESIMKWGKMIIGNYLDIKDIYFLKVEF